MAVIVRQRYCRIGFYSSCTLSVPFGLKRFMKVVLFFSFVLLTMAAAAQPKAEAAIRRLLHTQTEAWNRGDLDGFMQTYHKSDSLLFVGKRGVVWGWRQTLENYKHSYPDKAAMGILSFGIIQVKKLSARYYHVTGKWMLQRAGDAPSGHYTLLLRKIKGAWKIVSDHSS